MAVGTGAYFIAIFTTALSTVLLALLAPVSERLEQRAEEQWKMHQSTQKKSAAHTGEEYKETRFMD